MDIAGIQRQVVLDHQSGDPQIVAGDGGTLLAELAVEPGEVMRRLIIGEKRHDRLLGKKEEEMALVFGGSGAAEKARAEFGQADVAEVDSFAAPLSV